MTFDRHPASVVRPESAPKLLTDLDQKLELFAATGLDATIVIHFDEAQSREDPGAFRAPRAHRLSRHVDRRRRRGLPLRPRPRGQRRHVAQARGETATSRCSRSSWCRAPTGSTSRSARPPFAVRWPAGRSSWPPTCSAGRSRRAGSWSSGDQRGRLLGFPTANVEVPNVVCVPADGVYAGYYERPERRRPPVRAQPRPAADVLRARRPLAARGAPARLRGRPLRRASRGPLHPLPAQRAQVQRHRRLDRRS